MKFLAPPVLPVHTAHPTTPTPVVGSTYYNSTDDTVYVYDGAAWDAMGHTLGRANLLTAEDASFETGTGSWMAGTLTTIARSTAQAAHGAASLALTRITSLGDINADTTYSTIRVSPGNTYTAMVSFLAATTGRAVWLDIDWYQSNGTTYISSTNITGADVTTGWTNLVATGAAPANALFARIFVGATGAGINEVHYIEKAGFFEGTVTAWEMPTIEQPSPVNLLTPNQASLEFDTSGWYQDTYWSNSMTVAWDATVSMDGLASLKLTTTSSGAGYRPAVMTIPLGNLGMSGAPATPNEIYTAFVWMKAATVGRPVLVDIYWYNGAGDYLTNVAATWWFNLSTTAWTQVTLTAKAPANARYGAIQVVFDDVLLNGESFYLDRASFHQGSSLCWVYPPDRPDVLDGLVCMGGL